MVENGFFYDILFTTPVTEDDLGKLENEMRKIIAEGHDMVREEISIDQAVAKFGEMNQDFKVELLRDLKEKGRPAFAKASAGRPRSTRRKRRTSTWLDQTSRACTTRASSSTCAVARTWQTSKRLVRSNSEARRRLLARQRGDPQMQRIYGLAFETQQELDTYLTMLEEAKKRDHRKLGKELELFTVIDDIGSGLPLFYPKGAILRRMVETFISNLQEPRGYTPIWIPHITKGKLYETSGHLQKYDAMYPPMHLEGEADTT